MGAANTGLNCSQLSISRSPKFMLRPSISIQNNIQYVSFTTHLGLTELTSTCQTSSLIMKVGRIRCFPIRASASDDSDSDSDNSIAPLKLHTYSGKYLIQIFNSHRNFFPTALDYKLKGLELRLERQREERMKSLAVARDTMGSFTWSSLRNEVEEILYILVVQKFREANISLILSIISPSSIDRTGRANTWVSQEEKLKKVHSSTAFDQLIQKYLVSNIHINRSDGLMSLKHINPLKVKEIYEKSLRFGYFTKRVEYGYQLENLYIGDDDLGCDLSEYATKLDLETRFEMIQSKEVVSIMEKQTEALVGRLTNTEDELTEIGYGGLKTIALEALAFGSFLWEVKRDVDLKYHFILD